MHDTLPARRELVHWSHEPVRGWELSVVWVHDGYRDLHRVLRQVRLRRDQRPRNLTVLCSTLADTLDSLTLLAGRRGVSLLDCIRLALARHAGDDPADRQFVVWLDEVRRLRPETAERIILAWEYAARELDYRVRVVTLIGRRRVWSNQQQQWSAPEFPPILSRTRDLDAQYIYSGGRLAEATPEGLASLSDSGEESAQPARRVASA